MVPTALARLGLRLEGRFWRRGTCRRMRLHSRALLLPRDDSVLRGLPLPLSPADGTVRIAAAVGGSLLAGAVSCAWLFALSHMQQL